MQQRAADDAVARTRASLLKQPDLIFFFMTINAPRVEDPAIGVEILTKIRRWLLRNRRRSRKSPWSTVRGIYWWLDFAPRMGSGDELLVHVHILLACDLAAVESFAAREADRREKRGLRGFRAWVWPHLKHAFRREVVGCMERLYPSEFAAAKQPSFFNIKRLWPHRDHGVDTVVAASRVEILENVRKVADYSWATEANQEHGQLTMAQRVVIECLGGLHRGCSGVFRSIKGIRAAIASLRRRRILGGRMDRQMRPEREFERHFGPMDQSEIGFQVNNIEDADDVDE